MWGGEDLYRDLVENARDLIYCIDLEGNFTWLNRSAARVSGYDRSEAIGMNIANLVAPEDLGRARQILQRTLRGETPEPYDLEIVTRSGQRVVLEVTHRLVLKDGFPIGTQALAREMTERRRLEELDRDRLRILEMIPTPRPLGEIFDAVAAMVERQMPGSVASLTMLRDGRLYVMAAPGLPEELVRALDGVWPGLASGSCGAAAYLGRPVYTHDITADPAWPALRAQAAQSGLRGCWSTPVRGGAKLLGTLAVYQKEPGLPLPWQLKLLQSAAGLAGLAAEHRQMTDELAYQARHDALTELPNRTLFQERLREAVAAAQRDGLQLSLLYVDLDHFKLINDTSGHAHGDQLLRQTAWRLASCIRDRDTLARISGDEFVILLPDGQAGGPVAESVLRILREPFEIGGEEAFVTASVGIAVFPTDAADAESLLRAADSAMYSAKRAGKDRAAHFEPAHSAAQTERLSVATHLRRALDRDEFTVHYQPQFDLRSGALAGYEALLRWHHPRLGNVSPARFIPIAEESGAIMPIGAWTLDQACRQARVWQRAGHTLRAMSVNVSAIQLAMPDFVATIETALSRSGLAPAALELEITESILMRDLDDFIRKMNELRRLGVRISVDDFGTGYSSLSYLQRLPIDILKLDRSFVEGLNRSAHGASLVRSVVAMAHGLGLRVTAEGIETDEQLQVVRGSGCDTAQGYLLGRPEPATAGGGAPAFRLDPQRERRDVLVQTSRAS